MSKRKDKVIRIGSGVVSLTVEANDCAELEFFSVVGGLSVYSPICYPSPKRIKEAYKLLEIVEDYINVLEEGVKPK